jgi:hypothetical protein
VIDTKRMLVCPDTGKPLGYSAETWAETVWAGLSERDRALIRDGLVDFFGSAYPERQHVRARSRRKWAA